MDLQLPGYPDPIDARHLPIKIAYPLALRARDDAP